MEWLVSFKEKTEETQTNERRTCETRGRDGHDGSVSQGMPRIASNTQKLEDTRKRCPSSFQREYAWPY